MKSIVLLIVLFLAIGLRYFTGSFEIGYITLLVYVIINSVWMIYEKVNED